MTPSSQPRDWNSTSTSIRSANAGLRSGGKDGFDHFRDLVSFLFCMTIGHKNASVCLTGRTGGKRDVAQLEGRHGGQPLIRLTNDYFLRFVMALYIDPRDNHMRTSISDFQYQKDEQGREWVFRYEYKRDRPASEAKPSAHLHLRSTLTATNVLDRRKPFHKVHFPCGRPTIESTIRLLIDDFGVASDAPEEIWRPILGESEDGFLAVAHKPAVF
jgi:hypothetical protein